MPVFKQRSNLFCLMTNDYEVILEYRWGSEGLFFKQKIYE